MTRTAPTLREKLAAALLQLNPALREWAKTRTTNDIIAMFECDHYPVPVAEGGTNHPTNLEMILVHEHREKTAKTDVPRIAKGKRLTDAHVAFQAKILAKSGQGPSETSPWRGKWPSRPMQSRKFQKRSK